MAYTNFIPTMWAVGIEKALEKLYVFADDCNRKYEGTVSKQGESVKILGVGRPTITRISKANRNNNINDVEEVEDTSVIMYINQIAYFNFMVGDIDKAQASEDGIMNALQDETSEGLADEADKYIAALVNDSSVKKVFASDTKVVNGATASGATNILEAIDAAIQKLYENNVKPTAKIVIDMSPRFYTIFKQAYITKDTDNSEIMANGRVGKYGNAIVKVSNNVTKSGNGASDYIMVRTPRAIAYANPMTHVEPYRPEKKFADAVKGFMLFDAKVVRPKEIVNLNVKYA